MSECQNKEENIFVKECLKRIETDWNTGHLKFSEVLGIFPKAFSQG